MEMEHKELIRIWNHLLDINKRQGKMLELVENLTVKVIKLEQVKMKESGLKDNLLTLINKHGAEDVQAELINLI